MGRVERRTVSSKDDRTVDWHIRNEKKSNGNMKKMIEKGIQIILPETIPFAPLESGVPVLMLLAVVPPKNPPEVLLAVTKVADLLIDDDDDDDDETPIPLEEPPLPAARSWQNARNSSEALTSSSANSPLQAVLAHSAPSIPIEIWSSALCLPPLQMQRRSDLLVLAWILAAPPQSERMGS
jgi:hypothetical protein